MATCRVCSADITWSSTSEDSPRDWPVVADKGDNVPLDDHEERDYGPGRYVITVNAEKPTVAPIAEDSPLRTYVDHRVICQEPRVI